MGVTTAVCLSAMSRVGLARHRSTKHRPKAALAGSALKSNGTEIRKAEVLSAKIDALQLVLRAMYKGRIELCLARERAENRENNRSGLGAHAAAIERQRSHRVHFGGATEEALSHDPHSQNGESNMESAVDDRQLVDLDDVFEATTAEVIHRGQLAKYGEQMRYGEE
jgi:hypothetical protein